ncbi:calcium-binding protein [Paraburkholderia bonniea]
MDTIRYRFDTFYKAVEQFKFANGTAWKKSTLSINW